MTGFFDEMRSAWRGFLALLTNNRTAPNYFDFTGRGLAGAAIAYLGAMLIAAYLPWLVLEKSGPVTFSILFSLLATALECACAALVLRQLDRSDQLVSYLVAQSWSISFLNLVLGVFNFFVSSNILILLVSISMLLWVRIAIARLVLGLTGWQTALLITVQLFIAGISLLLILSILLPEGFNPGVQ